MVRRVRVHTTRKRSVVILCEGTDGWNLHCRTYFINFLWIQAVTTSWQCPLPLPIQEGSITSQSWLINPSEMSLQLLLWIFRRITSMSYVLHILLQILAKHSLISTLWILLGLSVIQLMVEILMEDLRPLLYAKLSVQSFKTYFGTCAILLLTCSWKTFIVHWNSSHDMKQWCNKILYNKRPRRLYCWMGWKVGPKWTAHSWNIVCKPWLSCQDNTNWGFTWKCSSTTKKQQIYSMSLSKWSYCIYILFSSVCAT